MPLRKTGKCRKTVLLYLIAGAALLLSAHAQLTAQTTTPQTPAIETGQVTINGRATAYRIRTLPVSSFPELPEPIASALEAKGCAIPQTYQAHHPENVVHGRFESRSSSDWAVLCLAGGKVSLFVFFENSEPANPSTVASSAQTDHLQPAHSNDSSSQLGFSWGIDSASPTRVHEAQLGMTHRPAAPDHDSLAISTINGPTFFHLYRNGAWEKLETE